MKQERMRMMMRDDGDGGNAGSGTGGLDQILDFEDVKGPLSIWLKKPDVIRFINRQFNQFLRNFKTETNAFLYEEKIHEMC
jgi:hypothetical protein